MPPAACGVQCRAELAKIDVLVVPTSAYNYTVQEIQVRCALLWYAVLCYVVLYTSLLSQLASQLPSGAENKRCWLVVSGCRPRRRSLLMRR